jgi:hypothetical protein
MSAETRLVQSDACLPDGIPSLERIFDEDGLGLLERTDHSTWRNKNTATGGVVFDDIHRIERAIPPRSGGDEINDWRLR